MSDVSGAAEAAPAPEAAPASIPDKPAASAREAVDRAFASVDREEAQPPRPVSSQTQPEDKPEPKADPKPVRAEKKAEPVKVEAKTEPKVETPPAKESRARTETGQFAPKEPVAPEPKVAAPTNFADPPTRFSADAKAAWAEAPEPIRAEVHRAVKELTAGFEKHKADAEAFNEIRDFADLAKRSGTNLKAAMSNYVGIEQRLRSDLVGGVEQILANRGVSLRDFAAHVMGQKPEALASKQDATIRELQQTVARLSSQVGGVSKTIEQQRSDAVMSQVTSFASQAGHERFEDLAPDIKFFIESGRATDLSQAYQLAERLNPGPASSPAVPASSPPATIAAQTRKGSLAVHGAPSSGSDPTTRKTPSSARNAVDDAFARLGL